MNTFLMLTDGLTTYDKREYIPNRVNEYMKQLKVGDTVSVCVDDLFGEEEGIVISNDGTRVVLQLQGNEAGKFSFRSFWVKNGRSCGPAVGPRGWFSEWLFYHIITPQTFGERVVKIIDFTPTAITVLSTGPIPEQGDDIPF